MATEAQIARLKLQWLNDGSWDIEDTDGFEEHRAELAEWRVEQLDRWEREANERLEEKARLLGIPGNTDLVIYLNSLEYDIRQLREQIERLEADPARTR